MSKAAATKKQTPKHQETNPDAVENNLVPENKELTAESDRLPANASPTAQAQHNEKMLAKRAEKEAQKGGYDPNRVTNTEYRGMTTDQAKEVVKSYKGADLLEKPNDLLQAERILGIK